MGTQPGDGTKENPFHVGGTARFDAFMRSFDHVPNVTFRLLPGTYFTSGSYASRTNYEDGTFWEPYSGWRILGSGLQKTRVVLTNVPKTFWSTKFYAIGNVNAQGSGYLEHFELAHLTIDANGYELLTKNAPIGPAESNFGCAFIHGSFVYLHDLLCVGGHQAMRQDGPNVSKSAELFILGISGLPDHQVTNNLIVRCEVRNPPTNRTNFNPHVFTNSVPVTTAIINGANTFENANQSYTFFPQIRDCVVEGNGFLSNFNPISMMGSVRGFVISNFVSHALNGYYTDDGLFTPQLSIQFNQFSNVMIGVYANFNTNFHRFGQLVVSDNIVYNCNDCTTTKVPFTVGIWLAGNENGNSFQSVYLARNRVTTIAPFSPGSVTDFGISIGYTPQISIEDNTLDISQLRNGIRSAHYSDATRARFYVCNNRTPNRELFPAYDVTSELCRHLSDIHGNLDIPPCLIPETCLSNLQRNQQFPFVNSIPVPLTYPNVPRPPVRRLIWEAEDGLVSGDFQRTNHPSLYGGSALWLPPANEDSANGKTRFLVFIPEDGRFYLWTRIYQGTRLRTTFDVEIDGERRWYKTSPSPSRTAEWKWTLLNEPATPEDEFVQPRLIVLSAGWHEFTVWARHDEAGIDSLCLTTLTPQFFVMNDALATHFGAQVGQKAALAAECAPESLIEAEDMEFAPPIQSVKDPGLLQPRYLTSSVLEHGRASAVFSTPRANNYLIRARMRRANPTCDSVSLFVDGREWILSAAAVDDWAWSSRIGNTENEAKSNPIEFLHLSAGPHTLELRWREPNVAVDQIYIEGQVR